MPDLLRRIFRPARKQSIFRTDRAGTSEVARVFGGVVACLIVAALLSSERLVTMAERQEFGPSRDRWLAAAESLDDVASAIGLDRPASAVEAALGRNDDAAGDIVLGELAAQPAPSSSSTTVPATTTSSTTAPDDTTDDESTAETTNTTTLTTTTPTTTVPPTTASTMAPPPPILGDITVNDPLRIWAGGDSLGEYVGSELLYRVADPDFSVVELDYEISTGLVRPDYYDWPARLSEVMQREDRPNVVVFMVGGNDDQDLRVDGERIAVTTPEWQAAYRDRVATMMDIAAYPDVQMLWINLPPMRSERREGISVQINEALLAEAELRPWVRVIDIVDMFTGPEGGYEQFIDDPDGGSTRRARAGDGVHITRTASNWVAAVVWDAITEQWLFDRFTPRTTAPPTTEPTTQPPEDSTSTTGEAGDP